MNSPFSLRNHQKNELIDKTQGASDAYVLIGALVILLAAPSIVYENKKVYFGLGRELSLAFGNFGEFRISAEYSFIFRRNLKHQFRTLLKYDILSGLNRGEWLSMREFISIGAGYFVDAEGSGIPAEISTGFRIGEGSLYLYPCIKLRHTFMTKKEKPDITDFSLGMAFGFQPF